MTVKADRLYVHLGTSQVRKRLKGHGFGVKKVETDGKNRAVIIHTATGKHLRQLEALFHDVIEAKASDDKGDNQTGSQMGQEPIGANGTRSARW